MPLRFPFADLSDIQKVPSPQTPSPPGQDSGSTGNFFDRLKRIVAQRARDALIDLNKEVLPDIPIFERVLKPSQNGAGDTGRTPANVPDAPQQMMGGLLPILIIFGIVGVLLVSVFGRR